MKTLLSIITVIAIGLVMAVGVSAKEVPGASLGWEESSIPYWYYNSPCQQPDGTTLHEWLDALPWYGEVDVTGGGWDCSQISAYVEWLAENCGHEAVFTCRTGTADIRGHCWVTIEGEPYEATGLYWIKMETADPDYYAADTWLNNVYDAFEYSGVHDTWDGFSEWAWWLTYPELRGDK